MSDRKILTFDDIVFERDCLDRPGEPELVSAQIRFNNGEWIDVWTRLDLTTGTNWPKLSHLSSNNRIFSMITSNGNFSGLSSPEEVTERMLKLQMRVL